MAATSTITSGSTSVSLEELVRRLADSRVLVGIPQSAPPRPPQPGVKSQPSNALIGYVMETGDPKKNIPARPFLVPGVTSIQDKISARLGEALRAAAHGQYGQVSVVMDRVGADCVAAVKATIIAGQFVPLSERTLLARAERRNKQTGKLVQTATAKGARQELKRRAQGLAASAEFAKPLYDTHSLFNSIQYAVVVSGK